MTYDRSRYIGGSDQADLLQIAPYGCLRRLVYNKRDRIEQDLSDNHNVRRGNRLEDLAAAVFAEETGRKVRNIARRLDDDAKIAIGADRHIVAVDDSGPGVLEIKCPNSFVFKRYKRDGMCADYSAQLNWYMGWQGWTWGSFAVFSAELDELLTFDVKFDAALFGIQKQAAANAWRLVENGPLPDALDPKSKACGRCQYFARCHPSELPTPDTGELVQITNSELAAALADYRAAHDVVSEAEELKEAAKAQIKAIIGDATAVDAPGARIYHRASQRETIDSKLLRKQFPDAAQACSKTTTIKTLRIYERTK
jgi:predicted phage-related endonuclease